MLIDVAFVEHMPRLQCCNVHINYTSNGTVNEPANFALTNNCIELTETSGSGARIELPRSLYINSPTMSMLVHSPGAISFRVCTDRARTFDEEYLCRAMPAARIAEQPRIRLTPNLQTGARVQLKCESCQEPLSQFIAFERILELPSENIDAGEWFCHHHKPGNGDNGHHHHDQKECDDDAADAVERGSNVSQVQARPLDLLYGQYSFVVHWQRLNGVRIRNQRFVHCQCGVELGNYMRHNETVKLWNEMIGFVEWRPQSNGDDQDDVVSSVVPTSSSPSSTLLFPGHLDDQFVTVLRRVVEDFDFLMSTVALPQTIRCLFDAHHADTQTYLFVQIMNPVLDVWRGSAGRDESNGSQEATVPPTIKLQRDKYIKVLYRKVDVPTGVPLPPVVASWQTDTTVNCIELSAGMLVQALRRLAANSFLVPERFRNNGIPGFTMSYLY